MKSPTRFDRWAAIAVTTVMGMSWPVLEVLGNNVEFFIARGSTKPEIWLAIVVIAIALPLLLASIVFLPGRTGRVGFEIVLSLAAVSLSFLFLRRLRIPIWLAQAVGLAIGVATPYLLRRFEGLRMLFRVLSPVPLLVVGVFALGTPTGSAVLIEGDPVGAPARSGNPISVVLVVFDEFPLASLIDPAGNLREDRYPGFARLAADGTWFRNAMTVQQQTEHSVPAILTGFNPDKSLEPLAAQYPNSLFTALARSHRMQVSETITRLCPVRVCGQVSTGTSGERVSALATDTAVIAGHVLLPPWATANLPAIDRTWGDFGATVTDFNAIEAFNQAIATDPRLKLANLGEQMANDSPEASTLYFSHVLLPHFPWRFLPTGQSYPLLREELQGSEGTVWGANEWLSAQAMQRHLLQVQYVDRALGRLIDQMEAAGIYDDALFIVVADHGIALKPDVEHWRRITDETVGDVAAIPLFVKVPGLAGGVIDDRRALTIDIVPTIADVLRFSIPWQVDGVSLLAPAPERHETTTTGPVSSATYGVDGLEKLAVASRYADWFPTGDPYELLPSAAPDLRGEPVDALVEGEAPFRSTVDRLEWYENVDPFGEVLPVRITGSLGDPPPGDLILGVAVNGTVGAVVQTYEEEGQTRFQAMVPPRLMHPGANQIEILWVTKSRVLEVP
ncbi:MAG: sulfatase-like hydrolase/transferase, partial [Acidimicrobiia bacterium]|nr:sulfatase-like hydrolase/transferase [Acidimicrobiia bacterium]